MAINVALDHCVIAVSDRATSDPFYAQVLGATIVEQEFANPAYRFDHQQLNVHTPATEAGNLVALRPVRPGNSDLCFVWEGPIESALAHIQANHVPIIAGPVPRDGGRGRGTSVYFRDPDGTLIEFISYRD